MIRKLRIKFIVLSMLALLVLLVVIVAAMNITNYHSVVVEADTVLAVLSENQGSFPQFEKKQGENGMLPPPELAETALGEDWEDGPDWEGGLDWQDSSGHRLSAETPYESRFFSVLVDENGSIVQTDTSRIRVVDSDAAAAYAQTAFQSGAQTGFLDDYRFVRSVEEDDIRFTFLDCGRKLEAFHNFMLISILTALAGYVAFFFVLVFFSKKLIRPVVESYEKQKRFITDAGHEIKTPLTIIRADTEILEMDLGENEWLGDIKKQADRLTGLTNDLIYLARTEETSDTMQMVEFPLSDVVEEAAASFAGPAKAQNKTLRTEIAPLLSIRGDEKKISQLTGILLDNALKYSPENTGITLQLEKQNKTILMTVYNRTQEPVSKENLQYIFDRFYRMDSSRNSRTGGYGIGLSMAKAIVEAHGGKISAGTEDGESVKMIVSLPSA